MSDAPAQLPLFGSVPDTEPGCDALVAKAVGLLREHEPTEGYSGAFSGGKDSVVIKELARMAGVSVKWVYNVTTIDPPELVAFIREHHADVQFDYPPEPFFARMGKYGFPTRLNRWCCAYYKERPIDGKCLFGIRAEESPRRAKQWTSEEVPRNGGIAICPILYWAADEVWDFIRAHDVPYCSLYDEGFARLGCVGCPMAGKQRLRQFERWPQFERAYRSAFARLLKRKRSIGAKGRTWQVFNNGDELFEWWLSDKPLPKEKSE